MIEGGAESDQYVCAINSRQRSMVLRRRDAGVIYLMRGDPVVLSMEMLLCIHKALPGMAVLQLFVTWPRLWNASEIHQRRTA